MDPDKDDTGLIQGANGADDENRDLTDEEQEALFNEEDGGEGGGDGGEGQPGDGDEGQPGEGGEGQPGEGESGGEGGEGQPGEGGEGQPGEGDDGGEGGEGGEGQPGEGDNRQPPPPPPPSDDEPEASITERIDALIGKAGETVVGKDESGKDVTLADMQRDYPTVTGTIMAVVKSALEEVVAPLGKRVAEAGRRAEAAYEAERAKADRDARAANWDALERKVPGSKAAFATKAFKEWYGKQSTAVKALAGAGSTPEDHVVFMGIYKQAHPEAFAKQEKPKPATTVPRIISRAHGGTRARTKAGDLWREMSQAELEAEFEK